MVMRATLKWKLINAMPTNYFQLPMPSNAYRHPHLGVYGRIIEAAVNARGPARLRRAVLSRLPFLKMRSDVRDVVYLTWLVPVDACKGYVPPGLQLWQRNGLTPFTILSFQHVNFGPSFLGPLRKLFPSPLQSNWRLYLEGAPPGARPVRTVLFLKNVMNSFVYMLATRLFSDALPTHLPATFIHRGHEGRIQTEIVSGEGSAPDLRAMVRCGNVQPMGSALTAMFGSWSAAVEFLACQDAAVVAVEGTDRVAFAEIAIPIDTSQVLAATCIDTPPLCSMLSDLQPVEGPFCFVVESVRFEALSEQLFASALTDRSSKSPSAVDQLKR